MALAKSTFSDRLKRERGGSPTPAKSARRGISEKELLLRHSAEHKIRHAAEQLSPDTFFTEAEFLKPLGLSGGYKHIVEREEFRHYWGKATGGVTYWGHPDRIAALKAEGVLR